MKTITLVTTLSFLLSLLSFAYSEEAMFSYEAVSQIEEELPTFMGGSANRFSYWVNAHLEYPEIAKENKIQGRVLVQFTVDTDGSVTNVKVLEGSDPSLNKEAVRVVSNSPKWTPGTQDGKPVRVSYTFPVIFSLSSDPSAATAAAASPQPQTKSDAYMEDILKGFHSESLPKGARKKIVDFKDKGYSISGYSLKNKPVENTIIEISDAGGAVVLYGVYRIIDGKSAVHGRHDYESGGRKVSTYGTFYVSNGADQLVMKPRKASRLSVTDGQVDIWSGFYHDCRAELSWDIDESPSPYLLSIRDGSGDWYYQSFSAVIPQLSDLSYENVDVGALLLSDTLKVKMKCRDNTAFSGWAFGKQDRNGYVYFTLLDGEKADKSGRKNTVSRDSRWGESAKYELTIKNPWYSEVKEKSFYLPFTMESVDPDSLYNEQYYWDKSPEIALTYLNGDNYVGGFKVENGSVVNTAGTYTYTNGDKFIGDLSGESFAGFPVDGKTIFKDGTEKYGNWLEEYDLTDAQYASFSKGKRAPSDVRDEADSLHNENKANELVSKAMLCEQKGAYRKARKLYQQAQNYKYSSHVSDKLKELEDKVYKQELVEKYGSKFADNIINKRIETGMTKEMCELVLEKTVGMEFYRESSWTDFGGNRIETWEYDFDYGVAQAKRELYDGTVEGLEEDGEEASLEEKAATALLSEIIMGFAGSLASPAADTMTDYKYLKFRNSVLVELKDSSFYDDINNTKRKAEDALNSLYWLFGE